MENLSRKDNWNLEARESSEGMKREVDPKSEWGLSYVDARRLAARARILLSSMLRRQSTESHVGANWSRRGGWLRRLRVEQRHERSLNLCGNNVSVDNNVALAA